MEEGAFRMTLDIVFGIGCSVQCVKYCPQEVLIKYHKGMPKLTLDNFKRYIKTIPKDELLIMAGVSEPFVHPEAVDIILYAHEQGYQMNLFTTLVGLKVEDTRKLLDIPFNRVVLHLPDCYGNAKIPMTQDYLESLYLFLTHFENLDIMSMGKNFVTDCNEKMHRGEPRPHKNYRIMCPMLSERSYMMLPDGIVSLCCYYRGIGGFVGDLNTESYQVLSDRFSSISKQYQYDTNTLCHICNVAERYWWYHFKKPISGVLHHQEIIKLRNKYGVFPVIGKQFVNQLDGK
jgi:hypothetical protein